MREIKFRAWWKEAKLMVAIKAIRDNGSIEFFVPVSSGEKKWDELEVLDEREQYELLQYTGLKDKNGKEIYEGDILQRTSYARGVVRFLSDVAQFSCVGIDEAEHEHPIDVYGFNEVHNNCFEEDIEVIGNIYENPELLSNQP